MRLHAGVVAFLRRNVHGRRAAHNLLQLICDELIKRIQLLTDLRTKQSSRYVNSCKLAGFYGQSM